VQPPPTHQKPIAAVARLPFALIGILRSDPEAFLGWCDTMLVPLQTSVQLSLMGACEEGGTMTSRPAHRTSPLTS
jgi:hypothetical protein